MSSLFKNFLLILIVCLVGVTLIKGITIYLDKVSVPQKKQIASKPKNFNKNYKSVEPQVLVKDEYTFFNTLHDPSMQKFVGLEGVIVKKKEGFSVQVGSFHKIELAEFLETDLETKGYPVYVESAFIDEKSEVLYRVFVGRFSTKIEAEKIGIKVKEVEGLASVIKWHEGVSSKVLYD